MQKAALSQSKKGQSGPGESSSAAKGAKSTRDDPVQSFQDVDGALDDIGARIFALETFAGMEEQPSLSTNVSHPSLVSRLETLEGKVDTVQILLEHVLKMLPFALGPRTGKDGTKAKLATKEIKKIQGFMGDIPSIYDMYEDAGEEPEELEDSEEE